MLLRALLLLVVAGLLGCVDEPKSRDGDPVIASNSQDELLAAVEELERAAEASTPPPPKIALPDLEGWKRSERKPLPPEDHGFTVAYNHPSGLTATLYQYTREMPAIADSLDKGWARAEMVRAKMGIEQVVELGHWQAAEETAHGTVPLGASDQKALWARYTLMVDGAEFASDIYIWVHADAFFKLRSTGTHHQSEEVDKALAELLTALGKACEDAPSSTAP